MFMKKHTQIIFFYLLLFFSTTTFAGFSDLYDAMEFQYYAAGSSLSASAKQTILTNTNSIMGISSTLLQSQSTKMKAILQDFIGSGKFSSTEVSTFQSYLNQLNGMAPSSSTSSTTTTTTSPTNNLTPISSSTATTTTISSGYKTISSRLDSIILNMNSYVFDNNAANIYLTSLKQLISEVFGSPDDVTKFLFVINQLQLKIRMTSGIDSATSTALNDLASQANNISFSNKISFLKRVAVPTNFVDQIEKNLFNKLMITLSESIKNLSDPDLNDFYAALVIASNSSNFTADERQQIINIGNNVLSYFSTRSLTSPTSSLSNSVDNFPNTLKTLKDKFNSIITLYKQGQQGSALNIKNAEFFPMIDTLYNSYLGDMITADYFINNSEKLKDLPGGQTDESSALQDFLNPSITFYNAFASDASRVQALSVKFTPPVPPSTRLKYLQQAYNSSVLSEENKLRFLWHIQYLITASQSQDPLKSLDQNNKNLLKGLILVLSNDSSFAAYKTNLSSLSTKLNQTPTVETQPTATTNTNSNAYNNYTNPSAQIVSAETTFASLSEGNVISLRFGAADSGASKYISVVNVNGSYFLKALHTTPVDTKCLFKVSFVTTSGSKQMSLESIAYPGQFVTYTQDKASSYQDLFLAPKISGTQISSQLFTHFRTTKKQDISSSCLVNLSSNGFLTLMSDESIVTTNFYQNTPFAEQDSSSLYIVPIGKVYQDLATAFGQADNTKVEALSSLLRQGSSVWNAEVANSFLKEIYYWLIKMHSQSNSWQSFLSGPNYQSLQSLLASLTADPFKKLMGSLNTSLSAVQSLLNLTPSEGFILLPCDNAVMWMSESNLVLQSQNNIGISFAVKTNGVFQILISDTNSANTAIYQLNFGEISDNGTREAILYKQGIEVAKGDCKSFTNNDFSEYQIIFNKGSISVSDVSGQVLSYTENAYPIKNPNLYIGLKSNDDVSEIGYISAGFNFYYLEMINQIVEQPYSTTISQIANKINSMRTLDLETLKIAAELASLPTRLQGKIEDWNLLSNALTNLRKQTFVNNSFSAKNRVDPIISSIKQEISRSSRIDFITTLTNALSFYHSYPSKTDSYENVIKNLLLSNLKDLVAASISDDEKNQTSQILNNISQNNPGIDPGLIAQLLNNLENQINLKLPATASIIDKITTLTSLISKIQFLDQREEFLNQINNVLSSINSFQDSQMANEKTAMTNLLAKASEATIFKDILGSLQYFNTILVDKVLPKDSLETLISSANSNSITIQAFIQSLRTLASKLISFIQAGLSDSHKSIVDGIITRLQDIRNNNPKFGNIVNDLDFVINLLQSQGDFSTLIDSLRKSLKSISTVNDRNTFLNKVSSMIVSYIEAQVSAGNVNEKDRSMALDFLLECYSNPYFKEQAVVNILDGFKKRLTAPISPTKKFGLLQDRIKSLSLDPNEIDQFLSDLTALSQDFKNAIANGWFNQTDIDNFNKFIDSIDSDSKTNQASGIYYRIYLRREKIDPKYDLINLKLDSQSETINLLKMSGQLLSLAQNTMNLSTSSGRSDLKKLFDNIISTWKIAVIFDKTKLNGPTTSMNAFYDNIKSFFNTALKNSYLIEFIQDFQTAQADLIEDQFEPLEKVAAMQSYLAGSLGIKTPTDVLNALQNIILELNSYIALKFEGSVDITPMNSLISACLNKSELAGIKDKITQAQNSLIVSPSAIVRIDELNKELQAAIINFANLTDTQKDNLVNTIVAASNYCKMTPLANLKTANLTSLENLLSTLIAKGGFTSMDATDLTNSKAIISSLRTSAATAQTTTTTTPISSSNTTQTVSYNPYQQAYQSAQSTTSYQPSNQQQIQKNPTTPTQGTQNTKAQGFRRIIDYGTPMGSGFGRTNSQF